MNGSAPVVCVLGLGLVLGFVLGGAFGCTRLNADSSAPGARVGNALTVKGSDTMVILGERWAEEYMNTYPTTTVQVSGGGSGTGIAALINGSADICESSRPMKEKEKATLLAKRGQPARETKVALDALAVYVNERSPVHALSLAALARIYTGAALNWREFGGADHAIVLYGRENNSGTYEYFKEHVLETKNFAAATQALAGTSAVANAVKGDPFGIGYGGIAYLEGVRALDVQRDENSPAVTPSLASAQDGSYPISRYLYFYTAGEPAAAARRFIDWVTGPAGQAIIAEVGYYPLPRSGGAEVAVTTSRPTLGESRVEPPVTPAPRSFARKRRLLERLAEVAIKAIALLSIVSVLLILVFVGKEALPVLTSAAVRQEVVLRSLVFPGADGAFLWQPVSDPGRYNILPLFVGTLKITLIALIFAVPLSVLAASFVSEFAGRRAREVIKPVIELLAGVPSVVVGFFALVVLATWVERVFGTEHRLNALVAGLGLAFAVCPIVFSISEDALGAVPRSYRAAAEALGATRSQTLLRVVLPAALPGILAATVLGFGRAIGETMIVLLASGNAALLDASWGRSTRAVTATIAEELGEVVVGSAHYHVLFALGVLLFLSTLVVNLVGERIVARLRGALAGSR